MERPAAGMSLESEHHLSVSRIVVVALVIVLHVGFVYGLATGLTVHAVLQLPQELVAQIVAAPQQQPQPAPQTPSMAQPTVPTVTAPAIKVEQSDVGVRAITAYVGTPSAYVSPTTTGSSWTPAVPIEKTHTIPPYPLSARRLAQQGTVRLSLTIDTDGVVSDAIILVSSGADVLDNAALDWVKRHWRYKPAMKDGRAVPVTVHANLVFDLKNA